MLGKKTDTPQVEAAIAKAANFEVTIADMARRSERRAWMVAWSAIVMALTTQPSWRGAASVVPGWLRGR